GQQVLARVEVAVHDLHPGVVAEAALERGEVVGAALEQQQGAAAAPQQAGEVARPGPRVRGGELDAVAEQVQHPAVVGREVAHAFLGVEMLGVVAVLEAGGPCHAPLPCQTLLRLSIMSASTANMVMLRKAVISSRVFSVMSWMYRS